MAVNSKLTPAPKPAPLTPAQIRAARALLRWRAEDLAAHSAVGVATVRRAELAEDETVMTAANNAAIRRALEDAGVLFIAENGGGAGVRLREPRERVKSAARPKTESSGARPTPPPVRSRVLRP